MSLLLHLLLWVITYGVATVLLINILMILTGFLLTVGTYIIGFTVLALRGAKKRLDPQA